MRTPRSAEQALWNYKVLFQQSQQEVINRMKQFPDGTVFFINNDVFQFHVKLSGNGYSTVSESRIKNPIEDKEFTRLLTKNRRHLKAVSGARRIVLEQIRKKLVKMKGADGCRWQLFHIIINKRFWRVAFDGRLELEVVTEPSPFNDNNLITLDI